MMSKEALLAVKSCTVNLDVDGITKGVEAALKAGNSPHSIMMDGMAAGMEEVGKKYEGGEYFLAELVIAGETMKEGMRVIEPLLKPEELKGIGAVVIGSVRGDLHDIGKNIVVIMLRSAGFRVFDLGVDIAPVRFLEEVKDKEARVVAMSALLTTTMVEMQNVVEVIKKAGIRDGVKTIVGGTPITEEFARRIGADAYAKDAVKGVAACKKFIGA